MLPLRGARPALVHVGSCSQLCLARHQTTPLLVMAASYRAAHNAAAWALKKNTRPFVIGSAPDIAPEKDHVVIKVKSVAINPIDWILQKDDLFNLTYPTVFGLDIAGEIDQLSDSVRHLQRGQRVIALGNVYQNKSHSHGAFQRFCSVPVSAVATIPDNTTFEDAVVLPLSITTAAAGLYQRGYLSLPLPVLENSEPSDRVVLIWGGSSSVGSSAIQLAVQSGATVVTTASPANFKYCELLGAKKCFNYHDAGVEDDIVSYLEGATVAGAYHAAGRTGAVQSCARIVERCGGKTIVVTVLPVPDEGIQTAVRVKAIQSSSIFEAGSPVGPHIWREYLPNALSRGKIVPQPPPKVVGQGVRSIQHGLDVQRRGVSALKIVVNDIQGP